MRKSIFESFTNEELEDVVNSSVSVREALERLGMRDVGGNRRSFYKVLEKRSISIKSLEENRLNAYKNGEFSNNKRNNEEIFTENSLVSRAVLKNRILKEEILEYKCVKCGNKGEWQGEELVLHIEHKNGIGNDNRIENLEFLCPNCHSQTKTFAGRNSKNVNTLPKLKEPKKLLSKQELKKINIESHRSKRRLTKENISFILENKENLSKRKMGEMFGVSDKTIAKIIKRRGYVELSSEE